MKTRIVLVVALVLVVLTGTHAVYAQNQPACKQPLDTGTIRAMIEANCTQLVTNYPIIRDYAKNIPPDNFIDYQDYQKANSDYRNCESTGLDFEKYLAITYAYGKGCDLDTGKSRVEWMMMRDCQSLMDNFADHIREYDTDADGKISLQEYREAMIQIIQKRNDMFEQLRQGTIGNMAIQRLTLTIPAVFNAYRLQCQIPATPLSTSVVSSISIMKGEDDIIIPFKENEVRKEKIIKWTIIKTGDITITNITPTGCERGLQCEILNTSTLASKNNLNNVVDSVPQIGYFSLLSATGLKQIARSNLALFDSPSCVQDVVVNVAPDNSYVDFAISGADFDQVRVQVYTWRTFVFTILIFFNSYHKLVWDSGWIDAKGPNTTLRWQPTNKIKPGNYIYVVRARANAPSVCSSNEKRSSFNVLFPRDSGTNTTTDNQNANLGSNNGTNTPVSNSGVECVTEVNAWVQSNGYIASFEIYHRQANSMRIRIFNTSGSTTPIWDSGWFTVTGGNVRYQDWDMTLLGRIPKGQALIYKVAARPGEGVPAPCTENEVTGTFTTATSCTPGWHCQTGPGAGPSPTRVYVTSTCDITNIEVCQNNCERGECDPQPVGPGIGNGGTPPAPGSSIPDLAGCPADRVSQLVQQYPKIQYYANLLVNDNIISDQEFLEAVEDWVNGTISDQEYSATHAFYINGCEVTTTTPGPGDGGGGSDNRYTDFCEPSNVEYLYNLYPEELQYYSNLFIPDNVINDSEFFQAIDDWVDENLENQPFFAIVEMWVGQCKIPEGGSVDVSDLTCEDLTNNYYDLLLRYANQVMENYIVDPEEVVVAAGDFSNGLISQEEMVAVREASKKQCRLPSQQEGPVASFIANPTYGCPPPLTVTFDASQSYDSNGGMIVRYAWDFGDGAQIEGPSPQATHTYQSEGVYTVTLTVTSDSGRTDSVSMQIGVCQHPGGNGNGNGYGGGDGNGYDGNGGVDDSVEGISVIVVEEKITATYQDISPDEYNLGITVELSDGTSQTSDTVRVRLARVASGTFNIELTGPSQWQPGGQSCEGPNGEVGKTGESVAPKVKLSWRWQDISMNECSRIYCDPTQFSIALAKRLHEIWQNRDNEARVNELSTFEANLIADNFSDDFFKDFAFFYSNKAQDFFSVEEWFSGCEYGDPWVKYFEKPGVNLIFSPTRIAESGRYRVSISFDFSGDPDLEENFALFESCELRDEVKITVNFEKIGNIPADQDSVFYHLPFNGLVGYYREDEDGQKERKNYGIGYTNTNGVITISEMGAQHNIFSNEISAIKMIEIERSNDYWQINDSKRGVLLEYDGSRLYFAPSVAIPVIMGARASNSIAQAFYILEQAAEIFGMDEDYLNYWTLAATSPELGCAAFDGSQYVEEPDQLARNYGDNTCTDTPPSTSNYSHGFFWDSASDGAVFLKTIFYTPYSPEDTQPFVLKNACSQDSIFAAPYVSPSGSLSYKVSRNQNEQIGLAEVDTRVESLRALVRLVREGKVCASSDGYTYFWNKTALEEMLGPAKSAVASQWGVSWQNGACPG